MKETNERLISLEVIMNVIYKEEFLNSAFEKAFADNKELLQKERAFITELSSGVIRNLNFLDYIIEQFSSVKLKKIKPIVLTSIRQGVYQIFFMDRTAEYAIVNEAVNIVRKRGYKQFVPFVNGVLRSILRQKDNIVFPEEQKNPEKFLSVMYSYPEWLTKKLLESWDYSFVKEMYEANNKPPLVTLCTNTLKTNSIELTKLLTEKGVEVSNSDINSNTLYCKRLTDIANNEYFRSGFFHVQDLSSQLAVKVLDPKPGEFIMDVCAAPGGKSFYSGYVMENEGNIKSFDIDGLKVDKLRNDSKRLGISIIDADIKDATIEQNEFFEKADRLLLDAPCSGIGLVRKKPDIKLKKVANDIHSLSQIQRKMLSVCSEYVKKGGVLLYSTCTIMKEENEENIEWFLKNFPFVTVDISEYFPGNFNKDSLKKGYITLYPHLHNTDGFFICKFRKV